MNTVKTKDIFLYLLILLIIILVIVYSYFTYLKSNTSIIEKFNIASTFTECYDIDGKHKYKGQINFDSNFYDLTVEKNGESPVLNNLSDKKHAINHTLGASNLCIYKTNWRGDRVEEIECMTSGELQNALTLPEFRKTKVCIDEECIDRHDIRVLHGETPFQISIGGDKMPTYDNKTNLQCLTRGTEVARSCSGHDISGGAPVLKKAPCHNNSELSDKTEFIFDKSWFSKKDIDKLSINPIPGNPTYNPNPPGGYVDPSHR